MKPAPLSRRTTTTAGVLGFALLTAIAAQIRVPLPGTAVPMTLQTLAVLLAGFCLRPWAAFGAMSVYLTMGLLGLPVLAGGVASAAFAGVTGGYLVGFLPGALVVSLVRGSSLHSARLVTAGAAGTAVVFGCGAIWHAMAFGGWRVAIAEGIAPFLLGAVVKLMLSVSIVCACAGIMRRGARRRSEVVD